MILAPGRWSDRGEVTEVPLGKGINRTNKTTEGELAECNMLSFRQAPWIAPNDTILIVAETSGFLNAVVSNGGEFSRSWKDMWRIENGFLDATIGKKKYEGISMLTGNDRWKTPRIFDLLKIGDFLVTNGPVLFDTRRGIKVWRNPSSAPLLQDPKTTISVNTKVGERNILTISNSAWEIPETAEEKEKKETEIQNSIAEALREGYILNIMSESPPSESPPSDWPYGPEIQEQVFTIKSIDLAQINEQYEAEIILAEDLDFHDRGSPIPAGRYKLYHCTIWRDTPELDFMIEHKNRICGCSNADNTIYVSALGDPLSFFASQDLATGSFSVALRSPGEFTGCCAISNGVLFFKEDVVYQIVGDTPQDYVLMEYSVPGVKAGCSQSITVEQDTVYYVGVHGVYGYSGWTPVLLSERLGPVIWEQAAAAVYCDVLYVSARERGENGDEEDILMAYSLRDGTWLKLASGIRFEWMFKHGDALLGVSRTVEKTEAGDLDYTKATYTQWLIESYSVGEETKNKLRRDYEAYSSYMEQFGWSYRLEWFAEFTPFYQDTMRKKWLRRLVLRVETGDGAWVRALVKLDDGLWKEAGIIKGGEAGVRQMVLPVGRCDVFRLKLEGEGRCVIKTIQKETVTGGLR